MDALLGFIFGVAVGVIAPPIALSIYFGFLILPGGDIR